MASLTWMVNVRSSAGWAAPFALAVRGAAALQRQELFFQRLQAVQAAAHAGDLVGYEPIHVGAVGAGALHQIQQLPDIGQ